MQQLIENVLGASDVTFKYILVTGYLAKYINPSAHARAIQVGSSLSGAYDARSLCHRVVVGFEKSKGNLFGLSNEPFVNKPARHPEHDGENPQLRNKIGAKTLHKALEWAQTSSRDEVYQGLVHILRVGSQHAANETQVKVTNKVNLRAVINFTEQFLSGSDGGCRLVAVWGAFQALLSENGQVRVYPPNVSDFFAETSGDVEVYYDDVLVSASECKQRPLNLDDVNHGIKKALRNGVPEYVFVISAGVLKGQEESIEQAMSAQAEQVDVSVINIWSSSATLAALLNPTRRAIFGPWVVELLRKMRKFDSANAAAELWNRITG